MRKEAREQQQSQSSRQSNIKKTPCYKTVISNIQVNARSLIVSVSDGDRENYIGPNASAAIPLAEFCVSDLSLSLRNCALVEKQLPRNPYMALKIGEFLDRYSTLKAHVPPFTNLQISMQMYATYHNKVSQAYEPFLEPWSLNIEVKQKQEEDLREIKAYSQDFLNLNITFGLALVLKEFKS